MSRFAFKSELKYSEITPEREYAEFMRSRREFLTGAGALALALAAGCAATGSSAEAAQSATAAPAGGALPPFPPAPRNAAFSVAEAPSPLATISGYNNYYEFGLDKSDPARNADTLRTRPWKVLVDGLVDKPLELAIDDILKLAPLEERVYRFRCVEGWSLVIPWAGFPLAELLKRVVPKTEARYVAFTTLHDTGQMPLTRRPNLKWPYREGLRLDEALHPLTLLCTGLYGKPLPNQNGAPVRLVVPWKYGFKSIKSIVRITLVKDQPYTTWNDMQPSEYGFYSNVNPTVDHPRWSQATERRVGELFKRPTLPFNGYAEQVAGLYAGMDLKKLF